MHIPDGYLSPSTCATLYGASAPFWYVALRRLKRLWNTQVVPLLSVFAAFSFVVMMFNLPLPGGTTGHAVGVAVAAIVLGPWAGMLAISLALFVQAFFFGDGGITTLGANCFNMAVVGSLAAISVYRLVSRNAQLTSPRRVVAAAAAGYIAINVSALCAGIEFGLQPMLFRDAAGVPLYAPYPLSISIPAMMLGHLTFAGLAELVITAGIVSYLQRADPALLRLTAPHAVQGEPVDANTVAWPAMRKLWLALAAFLILTPLGIIAAGSAWGEWSAADFASTATRQQIAAASGNTPPPAHAPMGLERLSSFWTAPLPRYAPPFIRSTWFGYLVSAAVGVGVVILICLVLKWVAARFSSRRGGHAGARFVESTVAGLLHAVQDALFAERTAQRRGFLQQLDPRVKLTGIFALVVAALAVLRFWVLLVLLAAGLLLAVLSRIQVKALMARVWLAVLVFTGAIALPAIFLTRGNVIYRLPWFNWPVYEQGLTTAALLLLRAEVVTTFSVLLILSTSWAQLLRSLRFFRVPVTCVVLLGMTYRYIFLLIQNALEMLEARRARMVGFLDGAERRRLAAGTAGALLGKSFEVTREVHLAMLARGYRGELYALDELRLRAADWLRLSPLLAVAVLALWFGR